MPTPPALSAALSGPCGAHDRRIDRRIARSNRANPHASRCARARRVGRWAGGALVLAGLLVGCGADPDGTGQDGRVPGGRVPEGRGPHDTAAGGATSGARVPTFEDPRFEDDPDVMVPLVGEPRPNSEAIEIDPIALMPLELPITAEERAEIAALLRAMQPLDLSLTSDHHDRHYILNKKRIEALEKDERKGVGWAALHAFTNYPGDHFDIRSTLLRVGARVSPEEAAPLLENLAFTYGYRDGDRAEALRYLAEIAPETFLERARPYLERPGRPFQTAPSDEFFARGWLVACRQKGESAVPMMSQVAMNFALEPIARYVAIEALGDEADDPLARKTLEEALVESTGDGVYRRKAAQSVLRGFPAEDACSLLRRVFENEADVNMARFLDDMIQLNCR